MAVRKLAALIVIIILASAGLAAAHPPINVRLNWDGGAQLLHVSADHRVNDRTKHYVMSLSVSSSKGQLASRRYDAQPTNETFSDSVAIESAASGDRLTVELACNIMGSASQEITID